VAADRRPHRALIRPIPAADGRPLRHSVLRPGQPFEDTFYAGDDDADTVHLGAFDDARLVGVVSLYREPRPGGPGSGWRLRGMATEPDVRGAGFGAALLAGCVDHVAAAGGGGELWCNARASAIGFYRRGGFEVVGGEFDVAGIGPHVVMVRPVPQP
jgi:predicted GNAT family N-acyltransferase